MADPFQMAARGSTPFREFLSGLTTFATMAYVLAVNPQILADAGMSRPELITATALAAGLFSMLMGVMANLPLAQAPGMGANALFAYTIVLAHGVPWTAALGLVFWSGVIFLILTVTGLRQILLNAFPQDLKIALTVGIGLFITFIGLKNSGLVTAAPAPLLLTLGDLGSPVVLLTLAGIVATIALTALRVQGAILLVIAALTAAGLWIRGADGSALVTAPEQIVAAPAGLGELWLALDLAYTWQNLPEVFAPLLTLVFLDLFSSLVAMNALCQRAGLADENGNMRRPRLGLSADALATMGGAMLGTSTTNVYAESAAGIETGGRTGLTSLVVGALFLLALFLSPLLLVIPVYATAPALVLIGLMMFAEVRRIEFADLTTSGPAVLTIFLMPVTSISDGLAIGLLCYVGIMVLSGRTRSIPPLAYALAAAFVGYYVLAG